MVIRRIAVIGGGVIGMTTALNILETVRDVQVTVIAEKFSPDTTSDVAAGFWFPHAIRDNPPHLTRKWGKATFDYFSSLAQSHDAGSIGVQWISGYFLYKSDGPKEEPSLKDMLYGFRPATEEELRLYPGHKFGWFFTTLLTESLLFLPWITKRILSMGGRIEKRKISDLSELAGHYDVLVNCTGCGANELVNDKSITPLWGQMIKVNAPWIKHFVIQLDGPAHVLPGITCVSMGGLEKEGIWNTEPIDQYKDYIWQNGLKLFPSLQGAKVISHRAGLRPSRSVIRLERENIKSNGKTLKVVHNYGHGGAGVTLCWGCALDATKLVTECIDELNCNAKL